MFFLASLLQDAVCTSLVWGQREARLPSCCTASSRITAPSAMGVEHDLHLVCVDWGLARFLGLWLERAGWKEKISSWLVGNLPRVVCPSLRKPLTHHNVPSPPIRARFPSVWKWSAPVVDCSRRGGALQASVLRFAKLCFVSVFLHALMASLWESRTVIILWRLSFYLYFLCFKVLTVGFQLFTLLNLCFSLLTVLVFLESPNREAS